MLVDPMEGICWMVDQRACELQDVFLKNLRDFKENKDLDFSRMLEGLKGHILQKR